MAYTRFGVALRSLIKTVDDLLFRAFPPHGHPPTSSAFAVVGAPDIFMLQAQKSWALTSDPLKDGFGFLWNTPKKRRSVEKRLTRRCGSLMWNKSYRPNKRIRVDHKTGEYFELGKLAPLTYKKIMEETKDIQEKLKELFGRDPKDKEVAVTYSNERDTFNGDKSVKVLEMEKERPSFFSPNLLQKVNKKKASDNSTSTVRPSGLG